MTEGDDLKKQVAQNLIDKTRDDYNLIADQFASTRRFNWGDFAIALDSLEIKKGAKILDLGCGNGRIYELLKDKEIEYYGLDLSKELIGRAKDNVPEGRFVVSSLLDTPYKDNEFDIVISVATLHHIPSSELRAKALNEIYRITKPGGQILITIWYFWNKPQYLKEIIKTVWLNIIRKSDLSFGDFYMNWKNGKGERLTQRYFHAWTKKEMARLLKNAGFTSICSGFYLKRNRKVGHNLITTATKTNK